MLGNLLIEAEVNKYNIIVKKFIDILSNKNTDYEALNIEFKKLMECRKTIKKLFNENPVLEVYKPEIRKVLKEIRENNDVCKKVQTFCRLDEETISDYYPHYITDINSEYDLENFIPRRIEAGAIIVGKELPPSIINLFDKIRECYMFGLYEATIIFCRALIEEILTILYQNEHPENSKKHIDRMFLGELLNVVDLDKTLKKGINDIVKEPAEIFLHKAIFNDVTVKTAIIEHNKGPTFVKYKNNKAIQQKALSAIKVTISVIEKSL